MEVPNRLAARERRRLFNLHHRFLSTLLSKPFSRWTKEELVAAIELHFHKPCNGVINGSSYDVLEAKLRLASQRFPITPSRKPSGRPVKYTTTKYRMFWESTQKIRGQIALEQGVAVDKVTTRAVADRLAEYSFAKSERKPAAYELSRLSDRFVARIKYLNRMKKLGKI